MFHILQYGNQRAKFKLHVISLCFSKSVGWSGKIPDS